MKINSLIVLVFFVVSCSLVRVLDIPTFHKDVRNNLKTVEKVQKAIDKDLEELNSLSSKWPDVELNKKISQLTSDKQNIQQYYIRLKEDFNSSKFQGRKKIKSQDKDFDQAKSEKEKFEAAFKNIDSQIGHYTDERVALNEYLAKKKVFKIDSKQASKDFVKALNGIKKSQNEVKGELIEFNQKASKEQKPIIQDLVKRVEKIENETFQLQRLYTSTMKELGTGIHYVTPGMKSHDYVSKIEAHAKSIQKQIDDFNEKAKKLR